MRLTAPFLLFIAIASGGTALAQTEQKGRGGAGGSARQDTSDEVIVRGKRLGELRFDLQVAREHAFDIFNEINSNDDFDVHCGDETRGFSHARKRVCRPRFENRIAAQAGRDYLAGLDMACPEGRTQDCMFSAAGERGIVRAQKAENPLQSKQQQLKQEIVRLANQDARFAQAILDYYAISRELETVGKRRVDD
jgi:hypothetical protein